MLILLNPSACEGNAIKKWEKIKDDLFLKYGKADIITVNGTATKNEIKKYIERGETDFIAAGGDGTINHLLNDIVRLTNGNLKDIRIGAIGLGSSNDFHKPYNRDRLVGQVYCRMDFNNTIKHDLCKVIYEDENHNTYSKYFVLNSSIGITAKANFLFNRPDRILSYLKRKNTNIAILYAAIKTILTFKNIKVYVNSKEYSREIKLTNMGIVKNPNFSGSFCYDTEYNSGNGTFWIHICENMSRAEHGDVVLVARSAERYGDAIAAMPMPIHQFL